MRHTRLELSTVLRVRANGPLARKRAAKRAVAVLRVLHVLHAVVRVRFVKHTVRVATPTVQFAATVPAAEPIVLKPRAVGFSVHVVVVVFVRIVFVADKLPSSSYRLSTIVAAALGAAIAAAIAARHAAAAPL